MAAAILRRRPGSREWWDWRVFQSLFKPLLSKTRSPLLCRWNWSRARALALRPALRCDGVIFTGKEQNEENEDQQGKWHTRGSAQTQ